MKSIEPQINTLIALAQQILRSKGDYMIVIEEYAQRLSDLEAKLQNGAAGSELKSKIRQLEELHTQVMAKVQSDKDSIKGEIVGLKKKGKVVITYTDQMPKSISLGTKRKI